MFNTVVKVAGVTFPNKGDAPHRQQILGNIFDDYWTEGLESEVKLELRREPENEYDPNAVAIWCVAPEDVAGQIGYVPRESAGVVGTAIKESRQHSVEFEDMGCSRGNRLWAKVKIEMHGEQDLPETLSEADFWEDDQGNTFKVVG